jgi:hypothetical protein
VDAAAWRWSAASQRGEGGGFRPGMVREAECGGAVWGLELMRREKIGDFSG